MFYNPAMAIDRDVGVAFVRARFPHGDAMGWEMLAATGVRGLRLLHEGGGFRSFLLTEAHPAAAEVLRKNAERYPGARAETTDAHRRPGDAAFDYVDLDPYGSPLPFLVDALAAVRPRGVLAVTATDLMVLAGAQPAACERLYHARPVRGRLGPEGGLRILLAAIGQGAEATGRRIRPLLAYVGAHHLRAYVEIDPEGPGASDPIGTIDPASWEGPELGPGGPFGPMWLGPLADSVCLGRLTNPTTAAAPRETERFLARLKGEAGLDRPFYYESNRLAKQLALREPPAMSSLTAALTARGFRVAPAHPRAEGFRTDAPRSVVEEVARSVAVR